MKSVGFISGSTAVQHIVRMTSPFNVEALEMRPRRPKPLDGSTRMDRRKIPMDQPYKLGSYVIEQRRHFGAVNPQGLKSTCCHYCTCKNAINFQIV